VDVQSQRKSRCLWPGCRREGRSYKPSYCSTHQARRLQIEKDRIVELDSEVPRWVKKARRQIMASLMRTFGDEIEDFAKRGHL